MFKNLFKKSNQNIPPTPVNGDPNLMLPNNKPSLISKLINNKPLLITLGLLSILIVTFLVLIVFAPKEVPVEVKKTNPQAITLTVWVTTDNQAHYQKLIDDYKLKNPLISVVIDQRDSQTYRQNLNDRLKSSLAPDIFELSSKDVNLYQNFLSPSTNYTVDEYSKLYYPQQIQDNVLLNRVLGVPTSTDGLMLAYNTDLVSQNEIPLYWPEFINLVNSKIQNKTLTKEGKYIENGIALDNSSKSLYLPELLQLLILQNRQKDFYDSLNQINLTPTLTADALNIYQKLIAQKPWDAKAVDSIDAFSEGNTAFAIIKASDIGIIKSKNPKLKFSTNVLPLISDQIYWSSYTSFVVSNQHPKESWDFLKYIFSEESQDYLYTTSESFNLTPKPYALKSQIAKLKDNALLAPIGIMAPNMTNWRTPDQKKTDSIFMDITKNITIPYAKETVDKLNSDLNLVVPSL